MSHEALRVEVEMRIHEVSCPGVWMDCMNDVWISIELFGKKQETNNFLPVFPLDIFEEFLFHKVFYKCFDPSQVCIEMEDDDVQIQLIQKTYFDSETVLAKFLGNSRNFLYPPPKLGPTYCRSKRELLIPRTKHFKGILSPKLHFAIFIKMNSSNVPLHLDFRYLYDNPRWYYELNDVENSIENLKLNDTLIHPSSWREFPDKRTWNLDGHPIKLKCDQCELRKKMIKDPSSWIMECPLYKNKLPSLSTQNLFTNGYKQCHLSNAGKLKTEYKYNNATPLDLTSEYEQDDSPLMTRPKPLLPHQRQLEVMDKYGLHNSSGVKKCASSDDLSLKGNLDYSVISHDSEYDNRIIHCIWDKNSSFKVKNYC